LPFDLDILPSYTFISDYKKHFTEKINKLFLGKILYILTKHVNEVLLKDNINFENLESMLYSNKDSRESELAYLEQQDKVWGGNIGIPRELMIKLNGFDEDFKDWGGEDIDFGLRAARLGYSSELVSDCVGYHLGNNFVPIDEAREKGGAKLFYEIKQFDKSIVRNLKPHKDRIIKLISNCK